MASDPPWDVFDYPFTIKRLAVTRGTMNQTTGAYNLESVADTTIFGSFEPFPQDSDERPFSYEGPIVNEGDARLHTDTPLEKGYKIKIALDLAGTKFDIYKVMGIRNNYAMMGKKIGNALRAEYLLKKEDEITEQL